jgi:hypothetical protein
MEDKRGVKRERFPSTEGSPLSDNAKTPPPVPSGSPPPLGSSSKVSSHRRCSPVFEQGSASGTTPVSSPSSLVVDTSRDEEFARKLGDGKIIIIDDTDDDDDAQDEGTAGIEPTTVPTSSADAPAKARVANSDDQGSD